MPVTKAEAWRYVGELEVSPRSLCPATGLLANATRFLFSFQLFGEAERGDKEESLFFVQQLTAQAHTCGKFNRLGQPFLPIAPTD